MNATLLARFRSPDPGWDQFPNLDSETLQRFIRDIETEPGWELDPKLVEARNKINEELRQRTLKEEEAQREAILYPGTPGRPPKYATETERQQAIAASKARYRAKHAKTVPVSEIKRLGRDFANACTAQGLDPVAELRTILAPVPNPRPTEPQPSNVEF